MERKRESHIASSATDTRRILMAREALKVPRKPSMSPNSDWEPS